MPPKGSGHTWVLAAAVLQATPHAHLPTPDNTVAEQTRAKARAAESQQPDATAADVASAAPAGQVDAEEFSACNSGAAAGGERAQVRTARGCRNGCVAPRCCILLADKKMATCRRAWEIASCRAASAAFHEINVGGCYFHVRAAVRKHVVDLGSRKRCGENADFRLRVGELCALAFLPVEDAADWVETLAAEFPNEELELPAFFEKTWACETPARARAQKAPAFPMDTRNFHRRTLDKKFFATNAADITEIAVEGEKKLRESTRARGDKHCNLARGPPSPGGSDGVPGSASEAPALATSGIGVVDVQRALDAQDAQEAAQETPMDIDVVRPASENYDDLDGNAVAVPVDTGNGFLFDGNNGGHAAPSDEAVGGPAARGPECGGPAPAAADIERPAPDLCADPFLTSGAGGGATGLNSSAGGSSGLGAGSAAEEGGGDGSAQEGTAAYSGGSGGCFLAMVMVWQAVALSHHSSSFPGSIFTGEHKSGMTPSCEMLFWVTNWSLFLSIFMIAMDGVLLIAGRTRGIEGCLQVVKLGEGVAHTLKIFIAVMGIWVVAFKVKSEETVGCAELYSCAWWCFVGFLLIPWPACGPLSSAGSSSPG
ncbi:unnamed protein product [Prorocentrum cordatum]|uniref:Uncharacterized protein n=1 Tax=Prorocentrum cordatum TaxID=2364126 RepID=A0ABN9SDK4_9DINO|nr:unnamed protein product [Polarella glacialis]